MADIADRWRMLVLVGVAELLAMTLWFSASAVGPELAAAWDLSAAEGRGLAIGVLVGALTVGSAAPHLLRAVGGIGRPNVVLLGAAGVGALGGVLALFYRDGPYQPDPAPFDPRAIGRILRDRGVILANGGYFGHMWELYGVWTWIPVYLAASLSAAGVAGADRLAALLAFGTIAIGGVGAWLAGSAADRWGRTVVTSASMVVSGAASVLAGVVFGAGLVVVVPFVLVWGFVIVADSAQFSAAVSELAEDSYVGSALTLQTAVGFLLGTAAMLTLRRLPEANELAGGRG
jgi:predicted MFS family arabinose efflux permease